MRPKLSLQIAGLLRLVSPHAGVIRELVRISRGIDEPSPPILYQAVLSNFDFKKATLLERAATGKGLTDEEAIGGAIGEAIEHYCAYHIDPARLHRELWSSAASNYLAPQECVLYSDKQYAQPGFPHIPPSASMEIDWIAGHELPNDNEVFVPAALVYLHANNVMPGEFLCPPTSNGLAAGPTLSAAIRRGLCELIERDAFLIIWMNKLAMPEVDFSATNSPAGSIARHYRRFGLETRVFNISTDIPVTVMMAVSLDHSGQTPAAVVGLGCHLEPQVALLRALYEICQVRPGETRKYRDSKSSNRFERYEDIKTLEDHSAFFAFGERLHELGFLLETSSIQRLEDLPNRSSGTEEEDLQICVRSLLNVGCRPFYVDLTTADLVDFDIRVVRTLATGLQPMHFGYGEERLGGKRLYEVPRRLRLASSLIKEADLNPCPHPLA